MRPIETSYHGYRCRSRLEARWMVFFEAMGINFLYEPEGFEFTDGTRYLPDFYLPEIRFWAEVKPEPFTAEEMRKAESLIRATGRQLLMLVGPPGFRNYTGITFDAGEVTSVQYSIDVRGQSFCYWDEGRLFSDPEELAENQFSLALRGAVYRSRGERFEGAA